MPTGVELINPENMDSEFTRGIMASNLPVDRPACVTFDPDVTERICEALILWPSDVSRLAHLQEHIRTDVLERYGRSSMSLWMDKWTSTHEIARVMIEEFCDADQEGLLRRGLVARDEDPHRWYKDLDAINTWRVARRLVLGRDESGA